ncbi:MAG: Sensor kinase CusS [Accumulibacter sp.]|jgi:two-component system heavy metal sensor histidine kinase CusS|uniref:heavy metal sensor histidine kinase n=1 Tax=Accumulibacter sp. TaxID=2053492 RepID=UPI00122365E6|nr:heavy metal sensor histidine kinase [Accumulibacter sp.]TLD45118.1 MAG: Sensor kinase CusS [Accumulibacter sp.]
MSLTTRLALLFALLTATLLIVVMLVQGAAVEGHLRELDDQELSGKVTLIKTLLHRAEPYRTLRQRLDDAFIGHDALAVVLRDAEGTVVYAIRPEFFGEKPLAEDVLPETPTLWDKGGKQYLGLETTVEALDFWSQPTRLRALVGLDVSHHLLFLQQVRKRLWIDIYFAVIVAALFAVFAAHRGLAPLRRVTATARNLSADGLGERLAERSAPSEVRALVVAFNGMLERLESSFRRLADFSADIAHELRTPVSNLMTQTAVALSHARSPEEYREVLASNMEEYEHIARMVSDMLFLAQAENGVLPRSLEAVNLADEARALIDFYEALAEEKEVRIVLAGEASVTGDRLMIRRALSNLLSNALRHSGSGSLVEISITAEAGLATLAVTNHGDTIPSDQLSQIFERFHRASPERYRHGEGAGLGLAITRSIVETHGGRIEVTSDAGVTTFTLHLPLAPAAASASVTET